MAKTQMGWSTGHTKRIDGGAYLLYVVVAGTAGQTSERLVVAAWSDTHQNWRYGEDDEGPAMPVGLSNIEGAVTVICWLFIPHIPASAFATASRISDRPVKKQEQNGRNDNPEDHSESLEFEFDDFDDE